MKNRINAGWSLLVTLCILLFFQFNAVGQSSNCVSATPIVFSDSIACVNGTNAGAPFYDTLFCNIAPANFVWYTYVAQGTTNTFTLTPGTLTNAELVIFLGGCPSSPNGVQQICRTGTNSDSITRVWGTSAGDQVWVGIASNGGTNGTFQLCIKSVTPPTPSIGQFCSTAIPICSESKYTQAAMSQNGSSGQTPNCFANPTQQDIFLKFKITKSGTLAWTATPNVLTDEFDWCLWNITSGCPGTATCCNYNYANGSSLGFGMQNSTGNVACGYNYASGIPAKEFSPPIAVTAGQVYVIQISNYLSTGNGFTLAWTNSTCSIGDSAYFTVTPAGAICSDSAIVNINSLNMGAATYTFGDGSSAYTGINPPAHIYTTPGTYAITGIVNDSVCPGSYTQYVELYKPLVAYIDSVPVNCSGICNGMAMVDSVKGGDGGPYSFLWNNNNTSDTISNLCSGIYSVKITDANTCSISASINLSITVDSIITNWVHEDTCSGCSNGSASVSIIGVMQNTIVWSDSTQTGYVALLNHTSDTITNLPAGVYVCTVTDSCEASKSDTIRITQPMVTSVQSVNSLNDVIISPSPNTGLFSILLKGSGYQKVVVYNECGQEITDKLLNVVNTNKGINVDMSGTPDGIYFVQIININGVINKKVVIQR